MSRVDASGTPRPLVLVVEDNEASQRLAILMLDRLGYRVDLVANGAAAVQAVACTTYAAVLMDCQMPVMDGYEATVEIRRIQQGALRTPVIAMTAGSMDRDVERAIEVGMDDFVTKPVDLAELGSVLARWITPPTSPPSPDRRDR